MTVEWSKTGRKHRQEHKENEDVILHGSTRRFEMIALADGVSSCEKAREGAQAACEEIRNLFLCKGDFFLNCEKKKRAELVVEHIVYKLKQKAQESKVSVEEYASTLAAVLLEKKTKRLLYFTIGDSMLLAVRPESSRVLAGFAENSFGCPVTTTKGIAGLVQSEVIDASALQSVLLCSDGAWQLMADEGKICPICSRMLQMLEFGQLGNYLEKQNGMDDCSFITMEIN